MALQLKRRGVKLQLSLVDVNPRARRFVQANVQLNGMKLNSGEKIMADTTGDSVASFFHGDLYNARSTPKSDVTVSVTADGLPLLFDIILANPPYWPLENNLLYQSGGHYGERVTKRIIGEGVAD